MTALPKHFLAALIAFFVIGLLGAGAWFWTAGRLDDAVQSRAEVIQQLSALNAKGLFPDNSNLKTLQDNLQAATALAAQMEPPLTQAALALAPYVGADGKGLGPDAWKQLMIEKREELRKQAESARVQIADDFYFGFKRYRLASPPAASTRHLGIQLAAIEALSRAVIEARVNTLTEIRRVIPAEESPGQPASPSSDEALAAVIADGSGGLYQVYPFEIRLQTSAASMFRLINLLNQSKQFFIVRAVEIENQKASIPRRSEILAQAGTGDASATAAAFTEPGRSAAPPKLLIPVLGQELINVRLRVDLIHWQSPADAAQPTSPSGS